MANAHLTFSGGPYEQTYHILDVLKSNNARATFFPYGSRIADHPYNLKRMHQEGHRIGNGTWSEEGLTPIEDADLIRARMVETDIEVVRLGLPKPTLYRPPYGATNDLIRAVAKEQGLREVLWDVDTQDWLGKTKGEILKRVSKALDTEEDIIVLMTDEGEKTVEALPAVIELLRESNRSVRKLGS